MGDPDQEAARAIVREICRVTGLTPTALARAAGMRPSTLTRFLNNPDIKHTLMRTISKLRAVVDRHQALRAYADLVRSPKPARRRKPKLRVVSPKPGKRKGGRQK